MKRTKTLKQAAEGERARIVRIIEGMELPLTGYHIESPSAFAAFNIGRWQQAVLMKIDGLPVPADVSQRSEGGRR